MSYFIAIDVETANRNPWSVCQIGLAAFDGSVCLWTWSSLVNPEEPFERGNVGVHGIKPEDVADAPRLPTILQGLVETLADRVLACHGRLDCDALHQGAHKHGLALPACRFINTVDVARAAWPEFGQHGLKSLTSRFGLALEHHDAEWDAVACGEILARGLAAMSIELDDVIARFGVLTPAAYRPRELPSDQAYSRETYERIALKGRADGPLFGHVMCCTGKFSTGKRNLAELAAYLGCDVEDTFSMKRTTLLVTGQRDATASGGRTKSSKLLRAEAAIAAGWPVTILTEQEFLALSQRIVSRAGESPPG